MGNTSGWGVREGRSAARAFVGVHHNTEMTMELYTSNDFLWGFACIAIPVLLCVWIMVGSGTKKGIQNSDPANRVQCSDSVGYSADIQPISDGVGVYQQKSNASFYRMEELANEEKTSSLDLTKRGLLWSERASWNLGLPEEKGLITICLNI